MVEIGLRAKMYDDKGFMLLEMDERAMYEAFETNPNIQYAAVEEAVILPNGHIQNYIPKFLYTRTDFDLMKASGTINFF